jgi:hypothetical protein
MPSPYLPDVTIYCGRVDTLKKRIKKLDEELGDLPAGKLSASRIAMVSRRHERAATRVVEELVLAKRRPSPKYGALTPARKIPWRAGKGPIGSSKRRARATT